ncbi:type I DNA topoisomerase [Acetobacter orientalis]|uniref:DNA topoisomerase 1 n=1 Tax=Acetobacter orientalis TaxID=146474 RepID=A0A2Z5ZG42_9PROT|nr:type I DNA topoisomerase [Acetobacter orientalis]BBC79376.1 DNA topoisomerase I [Acetobacter orientalis]GAN65362.1 DNA topoisomerase I [Acetobacter orientalis]GBR18692.1 DNA topoisomerase I [Acetobacter orientalis NRIC 0481]GEL60955.1 DNA topoisomerase 1 [Acetobacter orientalis]
MTNVVVVESPAKAKTINKYLGNDYTVLASFGHVRDLPPKDGSVRPDEGFAMSWQADERGTKQVAAIIKALKGAKTLYLATDPDREGEAISWHVRSMLEEKKALKGIEVQRVTFNEITKSAIKTAMAHPRELDFPLIEAYLARRALDYLVGFTLSPVLWRKLPGSRSAGRVQSVALRLICEREAEIEVFQPREYWSVTAALATPAGAPFTARLTHLNGKKLDQFDLNTAELAEAARKAVESETLAVRSVERRKVRRNPQPPFTTSTLQQEASRKLGMGAQVTMRTAQQLYEGIDLGGETVGLITYMRTDGVQMAQEAIGAIRSHIGKQIGPDYVPAQPRHYSSKAKNAQEAHEAIRPTDVFRTPSSVASHLTQDQRRLYELVWKRAVASQMESAALDQVAVDIAGPSGQTVLRANGSIITFDGFLRLYTEGRDDSDKAADDESRMLPPMQERDPIKREKVETEQHFTQPPPRYSEASLVKKMEEIGIGRPSTYASILTVLRDRNYVMLENRRFVPEARGRLVTAFLVSFFERYVDTTFTASLEALLDDISDGRAEWKEVLASFWHDFSKAVADTKDLTITNVLDALDKDLGPFFFPPRPDGSDPRHCTACGTGRLGLKLGRYGAFIGCSNYPECQFTRRLSAESAEDGEGGESLKDGMRVLGQHPDTGEDITVRHGPWGLYVQQGEPDPEDKKAKPKRASLPKGLDGDKITLEQAVGLLSLPRLIGPHPETGEPITAGLGRFGPYVKMGAVYGSLDKDDDVLTIGLNRAVDALAKKLASIRTVGNHPKDGEPVMVRKGRFGPYVQHGQIVATLPRGTDMDVVTLDEALTLLAEKGKPLKAKGAAAKKKAAPKKAATKKTTKAATAAEGEEAPVKAKKTAKAKTSESAAVKKTRATTARKKKAE